MRVMLSCGEASGDLYAGALVDALRAREPGIDVFGLGGDRFQAAGGRLVGDYRGLAVTGLLEAVRILPDSYAMYRRLVQVARAERPDVLVLIDFPDFNFRLMAAVKRLGVPVVYYVSPQLWAWRPGRIQTMKALVDRVLPIFPFEEAMYRAEGIDVRFVGHPLIELTRVRESRRELTERLQLDPSRPIVALLPGSRPNELHRIVPVLAAAVPRIASAVVGTQFLVARAPHLADSYFLPFHSSGAPVHIVEGAADDVLAASDAVITASGTATIQTALHGKPMVVVYRLSPVTYKLGKPLVRVSMFSMVNLVAGDRIVQELIQDECTPERVAAETVTLLTNEERVADMKEQLGHVREKLGGVGASARAADAILEVARQKNPQRTMKKISLALLLATSLWPTGASAVVVVPMTFEQLVSEAAAVVYARVADVQGQWSADRQSIDSAIRLEPLQYLKGNLGDAIAMRLPGGEAGGRIQVIPGAPTLKTGELVVVFLKARGPALLTPLGLGQGIFRVVRDGPSGTMLVTPPPLKESAAGRVIRGAAERRTLSVESFAAAVRTTNAR